jgi:Fur family transcriptional regulator, ferric uptake regulator
MTAAREFPLIITAHRSGCLDNSAVSAVNCICNILQEGAMSCSESLRQAMRQRGVRVTPQRAVILETVAHLGGHPTAPEVYREASRLLPGLNTATVYRALDSLKAAGLVDTMDRGDGVRFALHDVDHPHHHLVCASCGRELELEPKLITQLEGQIRRRTGFRLHAGHLTLTGHCKDCSDLPRKKD